jgi:transaldolase
LEYQLIFGEQRTLLFGGYKQLTMAIKQTSLVSFFKGRGDKMHEDDEGRK